MSTLERIFLYGPSGSGKTTVGRILAERLNLPFHDLDEDIESRLEQSIPEIFQQHGESGFRGLEHKQLRILIDQMSRGVISLGGGTLLDGENRRLVEANGTVVLLHSTSEHLTRRLQNDPHTRPLLAENLEEKLSKLLENRAEHYVSFPLQVNTGHLTPEQVAEQIQIRTGYFHLKAMGEYDVLVSPGSLEQAGLAFESRGLSSPYAIVCDENTRPYAEQVRDKLAEQKSAVQLITLPTGEQYKTIQAVSGLWSEFLAAGLERRSTVIAVGGGVISDLAGFAASTYLRGICWAAIPTTLLSMADASLGGKTGIDLPEGKNLAGAFHPPALVLQDPSVLRTLPISELRSGLGEVLKHGVIADPSLWQTCVELGDPAFWQDQWPAITDVVRRAVAVKVKVIEADPYEKGQRAALNYGHTIGHAVEVLSNFSIRHGECVAIGMVVEARMSEAIGLAQAGLTEQIEDGLLKTGLPTLIPGSLSVEEILKVMQFDKKKSGGKVKFALPVQLGEVREGMELDGRTIEEAIVSHTART